MLSPADSRRPFAEVLFLLGRPGLHLVAHRLLRRRDDLGRAALGRDLLCGRLREVMRLDDQLLGQFAVAQNSYPIGRPLGQPNFLAASPDRPCRRPRSAASRSPTLTTWIVASQVAWLKPRLGMRRNSCIWPPSNRTVGFLAPALAHWPLAPRDASCRGRCRRRGRRASCCGACGRRRVRWTGPLEGHSSQAGHVVARPQLQQALDRRLDQVDRVGAAVDLGQDVVDAARLPARRGRRGRP